jgi:hypothetical protein
MYKNIPSHRVHNGYISYVAITYRYHLPAPNIVTVVYGDLNGMPHVKFIIKYKEHALQAQTEAHKA